MSLSCLFLDTPFSLPLPLSPLTRSYSALARNSNIDLEILRNQSLSTTSYQTRSLWAEKLDRLSVSGATPHNLTVLYTSTAHTLVYPYEIHECVPVDQDAEGKAKGKDEWQYFSGYLNHPTPGLSYSGYSLWDTFRAQTAWLLLLAPSVVPSMLASMLQDYREGGRLPMWKNLVETNIMVGTHADAVLAQAMAAGIEDFGGFGKEEVWEAVREDAFRPPERDTELRYVCPFFPSSFFPPFFLFQCAGTPKRNSQ